jgi:hypothetical protein
MSDDHDDSHGHGADHDKGQRERTTAPQQAYDTGQVGVGIAVLVVGLLLTFGVALALA